MGANVSTSVTDISTSITNEALQSCDTASGSNLAIVNQVDYVAPPGCENNAFAVNQDVTVSADCYLTSLQQTAAKKAVSLTEEQQAAIGLNVSTDVNVYETELRNITEQHCTAVEADNTAIVNNTRINACGFIITQNATAYQNCMINSTIDVVNNEATKYVQTQSGWDILSPITDLFGSFSRGISLVSVGCSLLCFALIALVVFFLFRPKGSAPETSPTQLIDTDIEAEITNFTGGGCGFFRRNKLFIVIAILGIILMAALLASKPRIFSNPPKDVDSMVS